MSEDVTLTNVEIKKRRNVETDVREERVRISFDAEPGLKRALRLEAVRRDTTLTAVLISAVTEALYAPDEDDGCEACGSFSHPAGECDFDSSEKG